MKQNEIEKKINSILDELHRLTLDIIELKRATISLRYHAFDYLTDYDDNLLDTTFKKLEKITGILLDL